MATKLDKPLMQALRRENRGIKDDPQFSPYLTGDKYIVFYEYGHPDHLGSKTFRTKGQAEEWILVEHDRIASAHIFTRPRGRIGKA